MATLADVVDQLQRQNQNVEALSNKLEQVVAANNDGLGVLANKFSMFINKLDKRDSENRLRAEEARREDSGDNELKTLSDKIAEFGKGGGFTKGLSEGIFGARLSEFLSNFLGSTFGTGGILLSALPRLLGRVAGGLGLAGIIYTFGEDALSALFKQVNESAGFGFSNDKIDQFASDAADGLMLSVLTGIVTKNPFVKIGAFLVGYFKDEILNFVKSIFGIQGDDENGYTANLPFMESIDLGDSMAAIEATITGVVTAVAGLLSLFIARKFRGIPGMARKLLGLAPAAAGAGAGAAAGAAAGGAGRTAAATITAAQRTALSNIDDAALAAQGLARNSAGAIVRSGTNQFISNAEQLNLLAAQRAPRFGKLLGMATKVPALGAIITSGLAASIILDDSIDQNQKVEELGGLFGSVLGGVGGAALGGAVAGALGLTTGPGALLTGAAGIVLGGFAGDWAGRQIASHLLGGEVATEIPPEVAADISTETGIAGQVYTPGTNLSVEQMRAVELSAAMGKLLDDQLLEDYDRTITSGEYNTNPMQDIVKPIANSSGNTLSTGVGTYAQQSPGSARIGLRRGRSGEELNALDAIAATNVIINNYIDNSDNRSNTSMTSQGRSGASSTPLPSRDYESYDWYGSTAR